MWESPIYKLNQFVGTDEDDNRVYKQIVIDVTRSAPSFAAPGIALTGALEMTLAAAGVGPQDTILDFGAGKLRNTLYLLQRGYRVCAVEYAHQFTHSKPARENLARAEAEFGDRFSKLIYPADFVASTRRFKLVLLINVVTIMPVPSERQLVLQACHQQLADGGFLLWYTQRGDAHYQERLEDRYRIGDGVYVGLNAKLKTFYREFTVAEIDRLLAQAGFEYDRKVDATWRNQSRLYRKSGVGPLTGVLSPEMIDRGQVIDDKIPDPTSVEPQEVARKAERKKGDPNPDALKADMLWIEALGQQAQGLQHSESYEEFIRSLIAYLFADELRNLDFVDPPPVAGFRDVVAENKSKGGFFRALSDEHEIPSARVLVKCRNVRHSSDPAFGNLTAGMDRFLGFAMLAYRGGIRKNVIGQCQKLFRAKEKVILPLDDADFAELLDRKKKAAASAAQAHGIDDFLIARLGEVMVPIKVFVSYSRKDKNMMEELETALQPLADRGAIDLWIDRAKVTTGKPWEEEIRKAVAAAEVAMLLVSPDSVASRVINRLEVDPCLDAESTRGIKIMPVLLRDVSLPPELEPLHFVNAKHPVKPRPPAERDAVWKQVVEDIEKAILG